MTAFKRSQAKYVKQSYTTTNWSEYEAGLRQRGSLTVWISRSSSESGPRDLSTEGTFRLVRRPAGRSPSAQTPRSPEPPPEAPSAHRPRTSPAAERGVGQGRRSRRVFEGTLEPP
jgi:hypothetical protein